MHRRSAIHTALVLAVAPLSVLTAFPAQAADYFWRGQHDSNWNTLTSGTTNFATTSAGTTAHTALPTSADNILFAATGASNFTTTLGQNFTVNSLELQSTFTSNVQINGNSLALASIVNATTSRSLTINSLLSGSVSDFSVNTSGASSNVFVNSAMSGNFGLRKFGPGTLTFSGNNTYNGILPPSALVTDDSGSGSSVDITTQIVGGTLSVGSGGNTGSITGNTHNDGALLFNRANSIVYSGNISGSGNLTKLGAGTLTLSGNNTYTGTTTLTDGTLNLGSANALGSSGAITFSNGFLSYSSSNTADYSSRIVNSSGSLRINTNGQNVTYLSPLAASNLSGLDKLGSGTLILSNNNSYGGSTRVSAGTLQIGNGGTTGSVIGPVALQSANGTGAGNLAINRSDNFTFSNVLSGIGSVIKLGTGTLTFTGNNAYTGGTTLSAGVLNVGSANAIGSSGTLRFTGGTLQYSAANATDYSSRIASSSSPISIDTNSRNVTFASSIAATNTAGLTKLGSGTLTLSGNNAYTGLTTISAGTLQIGSGGTTGSVAGDITNNASLIFNRSNDVSYSGNISGLGDLTKQGAGTLTLTGNITHSDGTSIQAGTLQIGSGGTTGSITGNISNNTALIFNRSDNSTFSGNVSGPGSFTKQGAGNLTLTGSNSSSGNTFVSSGILTAATTAALTDPNSPGIITVASGAILAVQPASPTNPWAAANIDTLRSDATFSPGSSLGIDTTNANFTYASSNITSQGLVKLGSNSLSLTGNHSFTDTTVAAGTLIIGGSASGDGAIQGNITVNPGATLRFAQSNIVINSSNFTVNGTMEMLNRDERFASLAGSGSITSTSGAARLAIDTNFAVSANFSGTYSGPGRLLLTGSNPATIQTLSGDTTHSGGTIISAGILQIGSGGTTGSIAGDITNNAALRFNRSNDLTYSGIISGSGTLTKLGAGTLIISGTNTFTGTTTISAGTLQIGFGSITGFISGNITNNASLVFNRFDDITLPGLITGTGTVTKQASGILTLAPGQATPYQMSALTIIDGAINTTDNDLIVNYTGSSPLSTLTSYIANNQLIASPAVSGISTRMVLFEAASLGLTEFDGIPVDATTVIGKFTFAGDANLDGQVDAFDYSLIDDNFGTPGSFLTGDLNQDGFVDAFDYSNIDDTFGAGVNNPLRPGGYAMSASTEVFIPEPASLSLLALPGLLLSRRRRVTRKVARISAISLLPSLVYPADFDSTL